MKHISLFILFLFSLGISMAQGDDPKALHQTAKTFMRSGDFDNAILVLKRALAMDDKSLEMQKDLVMSYYMKRDYVRALEGAKTLIDRPDWDTNATRRASGDHAGEFSSAAAAPVRARCSVPSAFITNIFGTPVRWDTKAMCLPSGDHTGVSSL